MSEADIPADEKRLLTKLKPHPELIPDSHFLRDRLFAQHYDREIEMSSYFLKTYEEWKAKLKASGIFNSDELSLIDINLFTRAILIDGPFHPYEIFNLSLVYDNLYGSHLYIILENIEIRNIGSFLGLRRQLAMVQSSFISHISWEKSENRAEELDVDERLRLQNSRVELPIDSRVRLAQRVASISSVLLPPVGRLLQDIFGSIQPAGPIEPIGTELAKHFLEQNWMLPALQRFDQLLEAAEKELESDENFQLHDNIFEVAVRSTEGDKEKALILVGLMSIQRKALIRRLTYHYAEAGVLYKYAEALSLTVSIYYRVTEIGELIELRNGKATKYYEFLYPHDLGFSNNKFYHFWSEAFFSYYLRSQSHPRLMVYCGLTAVGCVYELMTSVSGVRLYRAFGLSWPNSFASTRMLQDIELHRRGSGWGLALYEEVRGSD